IRRGTRAIGIPSPQFFSIGTLRPYVPPRHIQLLFLFSYGQSRQRPLLGPSRFSPFLGSARSTRALFPQLELAPRSVAQWSFGRSQFCLPLLSFVLRLWFAPPVAAVALAE